MNPSVDLSIIVVNCNAALFLDRCLSSIENFLSGLKHEVCVVDNASTDQSAEMIETRFPQIQLIRNKRNLGFAGAMNQGLKSTRGPYVLWLNPDTEVLDSKMKELIQYLESSPRIGILGPKIVNPDGSLQLSCRAFPSYENYFFGRYSLLTRWFPSNAYSRKYLQTDWGHDAVRDVDWVSGACLLHRRELVDDIGNLDEGFFMYFEDVDFCRRAKQAGWKVQYHPTASVLHHIAGSTRIMPRRMIVEHHKSIWRYYKKYFPRNPLKDVAIGAGLIVRCGFQVCFPHSKVEK